MKKNIGSALALYPTPTVVVGAMKGNGSQHYVVVTGYVGSTGTQFSAANFVMNDPGSNYRTRLNEYLDLFPYLYKLIY